MRIGNVTNNRYTPNFGMKIKQDEGLENTIRHLQVYRGYSKEKIEGIFDKIKGITDDSFTISLDNDKMLNYTKRLNYKIEIDNNDVAYKEENGTCKTRKFFMLRSIKRLCDKMKKINKNAGSVSGLYDYAGK